MKKPLLFLFILQITIAVCAQQPLLLRQPSMSPDGSLIAFSFQGDIWTVPYIGGKATRLTIHEAYESNPIFSPDGKQIAFSSGRFGNNDIFVMPTEGGVPKRLTFHSAEDNIASWTKGDQILFSTAREFRQIERLSEVYTISSKGGTEMRILDALGYEPVYSPDGRYIAYVRGGSNPVARKDYKGSSNRELWLYDTQSKTHHKLNGTATNDISPQWANNNTLLFLSSEDGEYNLYRMKFQGDKTTTAVSEKLTNFKDESIRAYSISADGTSIVLEKDMNLYAMKAEKNAAVRKINVEIRADERLDAVEQKILTTEAGEYTVSPNGKLMAFSVRGEIFIKEADREKTRSINASEHAFRDMNPTWLNDSALLFCSDRNNGNFDFYLFRSADTSERNIFKSMKHELVRITNTADDESSASISPDGKKIAYVRGRGTFIVADILSDGRFGNEKILANDWAPPTGITWSPDSKWLAFAKTDLNFNQEIFIQAADLSIKPINVSMHPRNDSRPFWSADGTKLGFISNRSVDRSSDIWFVWLKKEDWEKVTADWQEREGATAEATTPGRAGATNDRKMVKPVVIDFENIHERLVRVTSLPGDESDLVISKDGETFYYTTNSSNARGRDLYSVKWDGRELKEITKGGANPSGVTMDKEGRYLYFTRGGSLGRIDIRTSATESLPFSAKLRIDYVAERTQVFEEAWRTIRDGFYDPKMHGYNWQQLHDKYKDRCIYASTPTDFRDMFNLLLGELNASHMGLTVPDRVETQREAVGLIGSELLPVSGGMKVQHIIPGTPSDKSASKLYEGDIIMAVNGESIQQNDNFYQKLAGLVNEKVLLTVQGANGKQREVVMRLTGSLSNDLYNEWVAGRRKLVDKMSNGKLGYIHIRSMDFPSFEVVEREFTAAGYGKEGIVIDVRYNGGGSTTDYLMTILNYKQHAYVIPRGATDDLEKDKKKFSDSYPIGERLVYAAWTKPSITLCNESSYSNAEIFSHAYKTLGIGKLVGVPTNGSVISTGGRNLMDGSFVRLPFRAWFTKATDKNQELGPAVPNIIVENEPDWISKGTDNQLRVAVETLLKEIDKR
jgi:tricorn protease